MTIIELTQNCSICGHVPSPDVTEGGVIRNGEFICRVCYQKEKKKRGMK